MLVGEVRNRHLPGGKKRQRKHTTNHGALVRQPWTLHPFEDRLLPPRHGRGRLRLALRHEHARRPASSGCERCMCVCVCVEERSLPAGMTTHDTRHNGGLRRVPRRSRDTKNMEFTTNYGRRACYVFCVENPCACPSRQWMPQPSREAREAVSDCSTNVTVHLPNLRRWFFARCEATVRSCRNILGR